MEENKVIAMCLHLFLEMGQVAFTCWAPMMEGITHY
jgi:hypothetical protein